MAPIAMSQATIENILKWNVDLASVNLACVSNEKVIASTGQAATANVAAATTTTALAGSSGLLSRAWSENSIAARGFIADLGLIQAAEAGLTAETVALTAAQKAQAAFVTRGGAGGGSTFGQKITGIGRGLFNAPDIGGVSTPISRGLIGGGAAIDALGIGALQLGVAAGVAVPLVLGLIAVTGELGKTAEESAQRAKTFTAAYSDALEAGTKAQLQNLIRRQQDEIDIAEATRDINRKMAEQSQSALAISLERGSADLTQRLNAAAGGVYDPNAIPTSQSSEAYNAQAEEQQKIIDQGRIALEAYNLVANQSGITTGQLTYAEEELRKQREKTANELLQREVDQGAGFVKAQQMTHDERAKAITQILEEQAVYQALADSGAYSSAVTEEFQNNVTALGLQLTPLLATTNSYADQLERVNNATQSLSDQSGNYFDALKREGAIRDQLSEVRQNIADANLEAVQKQAANAQDAQDKLDEIYTTGEERRTDIAETAAEARARIERRAAFDSFTAIANRDAVAKDQADKKAALELIDAEKNADKQKQSLDTQLGKQQRAVVDGLDKQVQTTEDAHQRQLQTYQRTFSVLQNDLTNVTNAQIAIEQWGANGQRQIHAYMWTDLAMIANNGALAVVRSWQQGIAGLVTGAIQGIANWGTAGNPLPPVTGTAAIQQIATQATRDYVYDVFRNGNWITAG